MSVRAFAPAIALVAAWGCNVMEIENPARPSVPLQSRAVGETPSPSRACASPSPEAVVACERGRYDVIGRDEVVTFLRDVARSLNEGGVPGGPFGILRKTTGNNCGGFSCDIICAGQGEHQRQWDVLLDLEGAQLPWWAGPHGGSDIRVDECVTE